MPIRKLNPSRTASDKDELQKLLESLQKDLQELEEKINGLLDTTASQEQSSTVKQQAGPEE